METTEVNFDGLVGPTHHYGGLSLGNIASMKHKEQLSSPKQAALQGLKKMKRLMDLGLPQALLPPQDRFSLLKQFGFKIGAEVPPRFLEEICSASSMWAANSATVTPSIDADDGKLHITIANRLNRFHRSLEAEHTYRLFNFLFPSFVIHPPLPKGGYFGDEGSANHIRFHEYDEKPGTHLFVYGRSAFDETSHLFPARQALEASQAVARRHRIKHSIFIQQNPDLIDRGIFHNDLISMGHRNLFIYHEMAFVDPKEALNKLEWCKQIKVTDEMLTVEEAISSYFFNSQIVTLPDGSDLLIAPEECRHLNLDWLPIPIEYLDIRESMKNGGGPACLRLPIVMSEKEKASVHPYIFLTESRYHTLVDWVERYYRDSLLPADLKDPLLERETHEALDALTQILHLGPLYEFQREVSQIS